MFQLLLLKNYKVHPISLAYYQILNTSSKRCTCVLNFYLLSWLHAKKHKGRKKTLQGGGNLSAAVDFPDYFWEKILEGKQVRESRKCQLYQHRTPKLSSHRNIIFTNSSAQGSIASKKDTILTSVQAHSDQEDRNLSLLNS